MKDPAGGEKQQTGFLSINYKGHLNTSLCPGWQ